MTDATIRPVTVGEAAGIARVHVDSWRFAYRSLLPQAVLDDLSIEARTRYWEHGVTHPYPRAVTLVAVRDGRVLGFCSCGPSLDPDTPATRGQLAAIYVDPASSRQGIGRLLMDAALAHLAREGFTAAELWVMAGNTIAQRFYEGYGWKPSGRTQVEMMHGADITEIGYHLDIDARA
jgi:ribosomal protein S18 acetylase RimI-like enzyme